jgi:hypothetical protein
MSDHTPGPWMIDDQPHREIRIGVIGDRDVETEWGFEARAYFLEVATIADTDDGPANARLIAAAPDLLAALKEVSRALECPSASGSDWAVPYCPHCDKSMFGVRQAALAAIAKAETPND